MEKKILYSVGLLLVVVLFVAMVNIASSLSGGGGTGTPSISIIPPSTTANQGDTFSVNVNIDSGSDNLHAAHVELTYDPGVLTNIGVTPGTLLGSPILTEPGTPVVTSGKVTYGASRTSGNPAVPVNGTFFTVQFQVMKTAPAGISALALTNAMLVNDTRANIPGVMANNGTITVSSPTPTPPVTIVPRSVYSAKFVCGVTTVNGGPVLKGNYSTAINVHNPQNVPVNFTKKAVIALQEGSRGNRSSKINFALGPDEAFEIDCSDIGQILNLSQIPMPSFAKGFVVIELDSPNDELDVVGVYTAGGANVESIDVEAINPKAIIPCRKNNININLNTGQGVLATDPNWAVTSPAQAGSIAYVIPSSFCPSPWTCLGAGSHWISFRPNAQSLSTAQTYTYRYNFTLPQCFSNANLSGSSRADGDAGGEIYLNGHFISNTGPFIGPGTTAQPLTFTTSNQAFFNAGLNEVTVDVKDTGGITGFDLVGTVTAT
jgi:hypothetical protein